MPLEDRWHSGFPEWDRYDKDHPLLDDYPYVEGNILNPFTQNVLKGDYPIIGQHTFFDFTAEKCNRREPRQVPAPAPRFESTAPAKAGFFGNPNKFACQADTF